MALDLYIFVATLSNVARLLKLLLQIKMTDCTVHFIGLNIR